MIVPYLWHHDKAEGKPKQNHVDAIHPPQKEKVRRHRGPKMACSAWLMQHETMTHLKAVILKVFILCLTFYLFYFHLPRYTGGFEIFKVSLKLHPFLSKHKMIL